MLFRSRDARADFHSLVSGNAGNSISLVDDSITYDITLEVDPDCPFSHNESIVLGPYLSTKGIKMANATVERRIITQSPTHSKMSVRDGTVALAGGDKPQRCARGGCSPSRCRFITNPL